MSGKPVECARCGQCCWYEKNGRTVRCRYLRYNRARHQTYCSVYSKRSYLLSIGENLVIDFWFNDELGRRVTTVCLSRVQSKKDYPGCPYNKGGVHAK